MPGDDEIQRLYDAHAPALFAFALNLTGDESDTRDLMQEAFAKVAARPSLMAGVRDERGFLLRLIHNAAIDLFRRRQHRTAVTERLAQEAPQVFAPSDSPDEAAFREAVATALGDLPPEQRVVLHLKLWEGLTFEAIAEHLEIPLNTAASRYRYGLDKLRQRLRPLYEELS